MRGFLHARRHALDDTDQDQKGDGCERKNLRRQHALQAVDPARRRDAESPFEKLVDESRAAEDEDQAKPDHEWRSDDRQYRQRTQQALVAKTGAADDQRKGEPERGASRRAQQRQHERVPGDPAAACASEAADAPDLLGEHPGEKSLDRQCAALILDGA